MKQAEAKPRIIAAFDDWVKAGGRATPPGFDDFRSSETSKATGLLYSISVLHNRIMAGDSTDG